MDGAAHAGRRPRPVADAPAVDGVVLTKAWLLALVADAPLALAGSVPVAELARGGPELCTALVAALRSDVCLGRLLEGEGRPPLAAAVPRLSGARSPAAVTAACEALRASAWRVLRAELRDPVPELVADLGDRLAYICAHVAAVALAGGGTEPAGRAGPLADALAAGGMAEVVEPPAPPPEAPPAPEPPAPDPPAAPTPPPQGVEPVDLPPAPDLSADPLTSLAQELATPPATPGSGWAGTFPVAPDTATVTRLRTEKVSWDQRFADAPPWLGAIERRLERREQDGLPFAVLVVEVDDLDRLLASQSGGEVAFALEDAERGLTAELAPADLVVRERLGRWWLTSPDRDKVAARDLGVRVAAALARAVLGGAPLAASIGVAVCPDDGESLESLAARADEGMFAARAAGVPLA
jgi:GGDEF domain-containing protein